MDGTFPAALDGSGCFECVSVGLCKLLFYNPLGYLCVRGHFFFLLLILHFHLSVLPLWSPALFRIRPFFRVFLPPHWTAPSIDTVWLVDRSVVR